MQVIQFPVMHALAKLDFIGNYSKVKNPLNHLVWKRPPRSLGPIFGLSPPCQLDQTTECHEQFFLENL